MADFVDVVNQGNDDKWSRIESVREIVGGSKEIIVLDSLLGMHTI